MAQDIPDTFTGTVEVDETYLGGAWRNKRKVVRDTETRRGRETSKQLVFGILCRNGRYGLMWSIMSKQKQSSL